MRANRIATVIAVSLFTLWTAEGAAATLPEAMQRLTAVADAFPPRMTEAEKPEIVELWQWVEKGMLEYRAGRPGPDEGAEFLLGEIYRLGHNLDMAGASDKAISHFKAAITIDPADSKTRLHLARHLIFSNQVEEGHRELLVGVALDPRGASDRSLYDLTFSYYFQQQYALAAAFAERYLAIHPNDPSVKFLLEASKKVLAGGPPPKKVTVP